MYVRRKAGRTANQHGTITHAVGNNEPSNYKPALCGIRPRPRGNGWLDAEVAFIDATCPGCNRKLLEIIR